MLIAFNKNKKLVQAQDAHRKETFFCCACMELVTLKAGRHKVAHFAHQKGSECEKLGEGETQEHLLGKQQLFHFFKIHNPRLEHYFANIKQRPDLLLDNNQIIEFQCSPISSRRLKERLTGYQKISHISNWILGKPYLKQKHSFKKLIQFMRYQVNLGFYIMYWDVDQSKLLIQHHIKSYLGKLIYEWHTIDNLDDLTMFINNPINVCNQRNHLIADLKHHTISIQKQLSLGSSSLIRIQNLCYQNGYNFGGYPLELDYPYYEPPLWGHQLNYIKIKLLLYLKLNLTMSKKSFLEMFDLLTEFPLMIDVKVINGFKMQLLSSWVKLGIIMIDGNLVKLNQMPNWFESYDQKLAAIPNFVKKKN
ncbi:competence protein CoiA [Nicoliella lavandulae]|uniref:Competence protein CoiA family protein n=1 Tax=Nicoliella lavandulae TaxID=3082954 RepID=A0ABU8SMM8_9LACO